MEKVPCNVIYVDRSVLRDRNIEASRQNAPQDVNRGESAHVAENVQLLLDVFDEGMPTSALFCH